MTDSPAHADDGTSELSFSDAFALIDKSALPGEVEGDDPPAEATPTAPADPKSPPQGDDAGTDENQPPGEDEEADPDADKQPPIERPRSWSKDDEADWNALPRSRQEKIAERERTRETDINRRMSEAATKLQGVTAKEQQAEQARQHYEAKAKEALAVLEREQRRDFPEIKSLDDLQTIAMEAQRLSVTDPVRAGQLNAYLKAWDIHQQQLQAATVAVQQADERAKTEFKTSKSRYQAEQRQKLNDLVPELADNDKYLAQWNRALPILKDLGFSEQNLNDWSETDAGSKILLSAAFQKLMSDSLKLADLEAAQKAAKTAVVNRAVPSVVRPGAQAPAGAAQSANLQALARRLDQSGSLDDAFALYQAQGNQRARRAS